MHHGRTVVLPYGVYGPDRGAGDPLGPPWRQWWTLAPKSQCWAQRCMTGSRKSPRQKASDYVASWGWRPPERFHSWPLKDSMLLGMDFLRDHRAKLDLDAGTLCLGSETICITWGRSPVPKEARLTLIRKIKVPAGSAVPCPLRLDVGLGDFMVLSRVHLLSDTLPMPHTYHASGDSTAVCLIIACDKDVVLATESAVGRAVEADLHVTVSFLS